MAAANRDDDPTTWFPVAKTPAAASAKTAPAANDDDPTTWFPVASGEKKVKPREGLAGAYDAAANFASDAAQALIVKPGEAIGRGLTRGVDAVGNVLPLPHPVPGDAAANALARNTSPGTPVSQIVTSPNALAADVPYVDPASEGALGRIGEAALRVAKEGPLITPYGLQALEAGGPAGRYIYSPLLQAVNPWVGAVAGGLGQAAYEAGNVLGGPRLGRDLYALNQLAPAAAMMPGVIKPGGGPVTAGTIAENTLQPWREQPSPAARYSYDVEPFRTREGNIESFLLDQTPETLAEMAKTNPDVRAFLERQSAGEQAAVTERQGGGRTADAAPKPTPAEEPAAAGVEHRPQAGDPSMDEHFATGSGPSPVRPVAAGADVTVEQIPPKTKAERITDLDKDVAQTVADRSTQTGPGAYRDENVYVEGIPPRIEAHKNLSPQAALDHKTYYNEGSDTRYNADVRDNIDKRNVGMTEMAKAEIGDANSLDALKTARKEVTPDSMGVFAAETPVDAAQLEAFHAQVDNLIARYSKDDGIRKVLENIRAKLHDAQGAREVLPSQLQKVRDIMTGKLEQTGGTDAAAHNARRARNALTDLVEALNPVMDTGAPKWSQWRQEWARLSQPINAQEFLQPYRQGGPKSLWNAEGLLIPRNVQRLLRDIAQDHRLPTGKSLGLTDTQIQKFVNIRNEIMPYNVARELAAVPGSPTTQLLQAAGKKGLGPKTQLAVDLGGQLALGGAQYLAGQYPFLNIPLATWQGSRGYRKSNALAAQAAREAEFNELLKQHLLSPDITRQTPYPNPLEKP